MKKTWCVGGRHMSKTNNVIEYEKRNPKTEKLVKIIKGSCGICGRNKSQIFTFYMTLGESFVKVLNVHMDIDQP